MELFSKMVILIIVGIACCAKDNKKTSELAVAVYKFIYNNERICGDMFSNSTWLPARHNCELRCRLDTEICQMSGEAMPIRRQRCHELPPACRRHLKKLVRGAALYTKPNKRGNPAVETMLQQQQQKKSSANSTKNALKAHVKPLHISSTNSPRQSRINTSLARKPPLAELVPLVKDFDEILIHPAQFHTTATTTAALPGPKKRITTTTKKAMVKPLLSTLASNHPPSTTPMLKPKHLPSPVDDTLQRMFEQLYIEGTTAAANDDVAGDGGEAISTAASSSSTDTIIMTTTTTTTMPPTKASLSIGTIPTAFFAPATKPTTTTNTLLTTTNGTAPNSSYSSFAGVHQWQNSAELVDQQPFAGNPFGGNVPNALTDEQTNDTATRKNNGERDIPVLSPLYKNEVFGPPHNPLTFDNVQRRRHHEQQQQPLQLQPNELVIESTNPPNFDDEDDAHMIAYTIGRNNANSNNNNGIDNNGIGNNNNGVNNNKRIDNNNGIGNNNNNSINNNSDVLLKTMPRTMEEVAKRQVPWWNWREFANALRQRPFYHSTSSSVEATATAAAAGGIGILSLDKSVRCCHWALEGLCDRSWQRVRELCPKSCGSLVCSSIDGTLSCNRAINVDVIACYEQRRRQQPQQHHSRASTPFFSAAQLLPKATTTTVSPIINRSIATVSAPEETTIVVKNRQFGAKFESAPTVITTTVTRLEENSANNNFDDRRAFAVENEMKMFMGSGGNRAPI